MIKMTVAQNSAYLEELQYHLAKLGAGAMPMTSGAMAEGASIIQGVWREYALGQRTLSGVAPLKNPNGRYAQSIRKKSNGPFGYEIFSEAPIARRIEDGVESFDMKETHTRGPRSRISAKGVPYLIVPFLWGTKEGTKRVGPKNVIPHNLLPLMRSKKFKQSTVKNETYTAPNARGQNVERWRYTWGGRAKSSDFAGTIQQKSYADGMVRFEQGEKGGKRYGGYFTFRVISAASPKNSWIMPKKPAYHVTGGVQKETEHEIGQLVENAMREDLGV